MGSTRRRRGVYVEEYGSEGDGSVLRNGAGEGRGVDQARLGTYLWCRAAAREDGCYVRF